MISKTVCHAINASIDPGRKHSTNCNMSAKMVDILSKAMVATNGDDSSNTGLQRSEHEINQGGLTTDGSLLHADIMPDLTIYQEVDALNYDSEAFENVLKTLGGNETDQGSSTITANDNLTIRNQKVWKRPGSSSRFRYYREKHFFFIFSHEHFKSILSFIFFLFYFIVRSAQ